MTTFSGEAVASGTLSVPAEGQVAVYMNEISGLQSLPPDFRGLLQISSSTPIHPLSLANRTNQRGEYLVMTIPLLTNNPGSSYLSFPHLADSGGYETRIILLGGESANAVGGVFRYRNAAGDFVDLGLKQ